LTLLRGKFFTVKIPFRTTIFTKGGRVWCTKLIFDLQKCLASSVEISAVDGECTIDVKFKDAEHFQRLSSQLAGRQLSKESNNEPTETPIVLRGPELREKIEERLATKISADIDEDGAGEIQIFFGSIEELERIRRLILGKPPLDQKHQSGRLEASKTNFAVTGVSQEWITHHNFPHSNPWWADPRDFTHDPMVQNAARLYEDAQAVRATREKTRRIQSFCLCALLVIAYFIFISWLGSPTSDSRGDTGDYRVTFGLWGSPFLLLAMIPVFLFRGKWARDKPFVEFGKVARQLRQRSHDDYRIWLSTLSTSDPGLYSQILTWEQNEEMLRIQRGVLAASQAAAAASQAAAVAARTNAENTTAIRNQIKYGHE
jgi:hypothetical protein